VHTDAPVRAVDQAPAITVGATFNLLRPPSANIRDGSEGFFWSLGYRKAGGKILIIHDSLPLLMT
jgi:hypothetical protein